MSIEHSVVCDRCASTVAVASSVALARADAAQLGARQGAQDLCARCSAENGVDAAQQRAGEQGQPVPTGAAGFLQALGEDLVELIVGCAREAIDCRLEERWRSGSDTRGDGPGSAAQAFADRMAR